MGPEPISQQIWLLEASKVSAKMGRGWQADWATAKIFFSNLRTHEINRCWKFQADILIHVWFTGSSIYIGPLVQFFKFLSPFQKNFKTNDTSIERTNKGLLHVWKKVSMAPSWGWTCSLNWKSITFTKTCLEPSMTKILAVSKLLSNNG